MISICITTSDMGGRAVEFLDKLLNSACDQKGVTFEIIVSDDSSNEDVKNYLDTIMGSWMNKPDNIVRYYRNPRPGKSSINMNHAISKAEGDIIKPMFCDDYFIYPDTLRKFVDALDALGTNKWAFCRSEHKESGRITHTPYPNYELYDHDRGLIEGCNTYGCPSAMAFRKTDVTFDENLIWLMDCEMYARMQMKYGLPAFVDTAINVREWEGQQSNTACNGNIRIQERNYVIEKHKR